MEGRVGAAMAPDRLAEFGEAWNRQYVDLVMGYTAQEECSYQASFSPAPGGEGCAGREATVREGVARFFERYLGGRFEDSRVFVAGDRGAAEWTFAYTGADGATVRVRGCDLLEFKGDEVKKKKDAFRKQTD